MCFHKVQLFFFFDHRYDSYNIILVPSHLMSWTLNHREDSDNIILGASHHVSSPGAISLVPLITNRTVIISLVICFLVCLCKVRLFMYTLSQWGHYNIRRIWILGQNSNTTSPKYKCPNCEWRYKIGQALRKHKRKHTRLMKILMSTVWSKVH